MKKFLILLLTALISVCSTACANTNPNSSANSSKDSSSKPNPNAQIHSIELSSENAPIITQNNSTNQIENLDFYYYGVTKADEDSHVNLNKGGYITNIDAIGDIRTVIINYDFIDADDPLLQNQYGFGYLKYRVSENYIDNPNDYGKNITTVGRDYVIDLSKQTGDFFISFWSPRTIEINRITIDYAEETYVRSYDDFTIQVISTNDIHGQIAQTEDYPGISSFTSKIQAIASEGDQFNILLDQGDLYQGTAEAGLSNGYNMDDFLLQNGFESTILGNHEFDWGEQRIIDHVNYSDVSILANNVRYTDNSIPEWVTPYKLVSRNGVKIGIIGAVGDVESSISASKIKGIKFLTGSELTEQIKNDSITLKEMGAEFIILSLHDGADRAKSNGASYLPYYNIATLSGTYVDLVLEGHTHQRYAFTDSKGVWHLQNRGNGSSFYVTKIDCNYQNGKYSLSVPTSQNPYYYTADFSYTNNVIDDMDYWYEKNVYGKIQSEVIGKNVPYMDDEVFEALTAKLYYEFGLKMTEGTSYKLTLGGGFIRTRTPYNLSGGTVCYGDVFNLLPFDNDLVLCSIKGSDLKKKFISTTNSDYFVYGNTNLNSIINSETYYILTDSYTSDYSYNNLTVIENYTIKNNMYARDLVAQYFKNTYLK